MKHQPLMDHPPASQRSLNDAPVPRTCPDAQSRTTLPSYVLITAARNEQDHIKRVIGSVLSQSVRPLKWVIVLDSSTDATAAIAEVHAANERWIELVAYDGCGGHSFARKAAAVNLGYKLVRHVESDVVANLDADVSFDPEYFAFILEQFRTNPALGVAGTAYIEAGYHSYRNSYVSPVHVHGQVQVFRRECFEEIGGYMPLERGGVDWVAVTLARLLGWQTRSFQDKVFHHHRGMGFGAGRRTRAFFNTGRQDYLMGWHPLWEIFRGVYQMKREPYLVRGSLLLAGYLWCLVCGVRREIPGRLIRYNRVDQANRLKDLIRGGFRGLGRSVG